MIKPSEFEKESKTIVRWFRKISSFIAERRWIIWILLILVILLIGGYVFLFLTDRINLKNYETNQNDINVSAVFFMFQEGLLKTNQTYEIELSLKSIEKIKTMNVLYMIPLKPGNTPPKIYRYDGDCNFIDKPNCEIKANISTENIMDGEYKLCVLVYDKSNLERKSNQCYPSIKTIIS